MLTDVYFKEFAAEPGSNLRALLSTPSQIVLFGVTRTEYTGLLNFTSGDSVIHFPLKNFTEKYPSSAAI